jgi:predicted transcriptional regulator
MEPKKRILFYLAKNPGLKTEQIDLGIKRSSLGLHLKNLMDKGLVIRTQEGCWQLSKNYILEEPIHNLSAIDITDKYIREMIHGNQR